MDLGLETLSFGLLGGGGGDFLTLDFGASSIKIAKGTYRGGDQPKVNLHLADREPVGNPAPNQRVEEFTNILQVLLKRNDISENQNVVLALPTNVVIVRYLELPAMPDERMNQVIRYEAESHIPFPLEEVVLDYHVVERTEDATEIILIAVKEEKLNEYVQIAHGAGLNPEIIDIAAFSLFNLYRKMGIDAVDVHGNGSGENGEGSQGKETEDNSPPSRALVDIGHANTDIIIFKGDTLHFARSTSVAGESMNEQISKKLGVEMEEAEELKKQYGHVPLEGMEETESTAGELDSSGSDALEELARKREKTQAKDEGEEEAEQSGDQDSARMEEPPPPETPSGDSDENRSGGDEGEGLSLGMPKKLSGSEEGEKEQSDQNADEDAGLGLGMPKKPEGQEDREEETDTEDSEETTPPAPPLPADEQDDTGLEEAKKPSTPPDSSKSAGEEMEDDRKLADSNSEQKEKQEDKVPGTLSIGSTKKSSQEIDEIDSDLEQSEESVESDTGGLNLGNTLQSSDDDEEDDDDDDDEGSSLSLGAAENSDPASPDDDVDRGAIGRAIKPQIDRLIGELRHTFDYFQSQLGGGEVDEIIVVGGGSNLKNLSTYLEDQLNRPASQFHPSDAVDGVSDEELQSFLVASGLILRTQANVADLEINLIPDDIARQKQSQNKQKKITALGVCAGILLIELLGSAYFLYDIRHHEMMVSQREFEQLKPIVQKVDERTARNAALEKRIDVITRLKNQRTDMLALLASLDTLDQDMREYTWFENMEFTSGRSGEDGRLSLSGVTGDFDDASKIFRWIEGIQYIQGIENESLQKEQYEISGNKRSLLSWSIQANVKFGSDDQSEEAKK